MAYQTSGGQIYVDISSGAKTPAGSVIECPIVDWKLERSCDSVEMTAFDDMFKTYVSGASGSLITATFDAGSAGHAVLDMLTKPQMPYLSIGQPKPPQPMDDIVTFGKYKHRPVSELLADDGYCAWWRESTSRTAWLEEEHPDIYQQLTETEKVTTEEELDTNMELYEYAVTYVPQNDAGDVIQDEVKILTQTTLVLAKGMEAVRKQAIANLDDKTLNLEYVLVDVRGFGGGGF